MSEALLEARGIGKVFPMGRTRLEVLRGCELRVAPGEFVAIMGKSGSGKSTLLHILGALDVPTAGEVLLGGTPTFAAESGVARMAARLDQLAEPVQRGIMLVLKYLLLATLWACLLLILAFPFLVLYLSPALTIPLLAVGGVAAATAGLALLLAGLLVVRLLLVHLAERRQVGLRRRVFGFVFQFYHLLPELNVLENVTISRMTECGMLGWFRRRGSARQQAREVLERVGLGERLKHRPQELSGGECQRVALARALVHRPRILLADEPTGNLDAEAGRNIMGLLARLHREGQTIVMVTHDDSVAAYADRVLLLADGRLQAARSA